MASLVNVDNGEELLNIPIDFILELDEDLKSVSRLSLRLLLHKIRPANTSLNYWLESDCRLLRKNIENELFHVELESRQIDSNVPVPQYRVKVSKGHFSVLLIHS